eukprot:TRINITY_DN4774_c0_g2_i1.p1 TRINITY_DN4774_c0_g2~~TRINITY_DN4774_c0_g2_i1.p1  ORF type:complete len:389 (+),score=84.27 TRINITY_DN4774_c0_g2_i1:23-1189(+)
MSFQIIWCSTSCAGERPKPTSSMGDSQLASGISNDHRTPNHQANDFFPVIPREFVVAKSSKAAEQREKLNPLISADEKVGDLRDTLYTLTGAQSSNSAEQREASNPVLPAAKKEAIPRDTLKDARRIKHSSILVGTSIQGSESAEQGEESDPMIPAIQKKATTQNDSKSRQEREAIKFANEFRADLQDVLDSLQARARARARKMYARARAECSKPAEQREESNPMIPAAEKAAIPRDTLKGARKIEHSNMPAGTGAQDSKSAEQREESTPMIPTGEWEADLWDLLKGPRKISTPAGIDDQCKAAERQEASHTSIPGAGKEVILQDTLNGGRTREHAKKNEHVAKVGRDLMAVKNTFLTGELVDAEDGDCIPWQRQHIRSQSVPAKHDH